ncbi:MAG: class II aldolase/adducin family protein [Candidatus Bathyarchaeia archaeon]
MEKYKGVKFRTVFLSKEAPKDERLVELAGWCRKFHELGLTPVVNGKSLGNLSFRLDEDSNKFIITASGLGPKDNLSAECFVKVIDCDLTKKIVYVHGLRKPSSESLLHYRIYKLRREVNAIFHGHDSSITNYAGEIGLVQTAKWHPYGSLELVRSVEEVLNGNFFLVLKGHGFISLGRSMEEAGRLALEKKKIADKFYKNSKRESLCKSFTR